ncbi:hypothetical protein Nepgr_024466 [Nepenthes gracilis]|uniref:Myb/SANT-like DNA-binding domain-containing protein n=1 Tax=Nepenthes gracilis TaxID=150966 RepID=A0AAD3T2W6_NEPGR|nr:hypothetical protein Nepgr_024466 [Nepenthes gracilis]
MSTPTTSSAKSPPPPEPPRKFPAPCWTQEETLALINAYRDKWYSLHRRNLRSVDWDAVATAVAAKCPGQTPPKTSAQSRHKMEKLRKRYRTEKQRAFSFPNRFFSSSWYFFGLMDSMESGSSLGDGSEQDPAAHRGFSSKFGGLEETESPFAKIGEGFKGKTGSVNDDFGLDALVGGSSGKKRPLPKEFKLMYHGPSLNFESNTADHDGDGDGELFGRTGFHVKTRRGRNMDSKQPNYGSIDGNAYAGQDFEGFHGKSCKTNMVISNGLCKKSGGGSGTAKGGAMDSAATEMVASIKILGDGFVKMEKMKMDMVREIEKMRMEMEMKRSEMILQSQQLLVNAFSEGLLDMRNVKLKTVETEINE